MNLVLNLKPVFSSKEKSGEICIVRSDTIEVCTTNKTLTNAEVENALYSILWAFNEAGLFSFVAEKEQIFVQGNFPGSYFYIHEYHKLI